MTNSPSDVALLKLQIGPVQDFIAQARSTRDLWSGSSGLNWCLFACQYESTRRSIAKEKPPLGSLSRILRPTPRSSEAFAPVSATWRGGPGLWPKREVNSVAPSSFRTKAQTR